jgi:predicted nucleic acid-binding protein
VAVIASAFLDTTVLVAGLIDVGPTAAASQAAMTAVANGKVKRPLTAWHCCLEFYSVATRLPPELRLSPGDAVRLLQEEVLGRFEIVDLPAGERRRLLRDAASDGIVGGRVYDLHIAEVARTNDAQVVVSDNRRHFTTLLRYGIRVLATNEFVAEIGA